MSTNFFARRKPSIEEKQELHKLIDENDFRQLQMVLSHGFGVSNEPYQGYHIGQRACGWQFVFQAYCEDDPECQVPWEDNLESVKEYLNRDDVEIINEYDEIISKEDFWNKEIGYCLYSNRECKQRDVVKPDRTCWCYTWFK